MVRQLFVVLVPFVFAACMAGGHSYTPLRDPPWPLTPRTGDKVAVLASRPSSPVIELGLLEVRAATGMNRSDVIAALRREAGLVGCDAIVITGGIEETDVRGFASEGFGYRATCVVYDRSAIVPATPLPAPTSAAAAQAPTVVPGSALRSPAQSEGAPSATTTATASFPPTQ